MRSVEQPCAGIDDDPSYFPGCIVKQKVTYCPDFAILSVDGKPFNGGCDEQHGIFPIVNFGVACHQDHLCRKKKLKVQMWR
jgi:hypothetical protein